MIIRGLNRYITSKDGITMTYHCDKCSEVFDQAKGLSTHRKKMHGLVDFICNICEATSKTHHYFAEHMYFVHYYDGKGYHKCDVCGTSLRHKSALAKHMLIHKQEKPHMCSTCGRAFTQSSTLKTHEEIHMTDAEKTLVCAICNKKFGRRTTFKLHVKGHSKSHQCAYCGLRFSRQGHMKRHIQTQHSSEEIAAAAREKARIHSQNRKTKRHKKTAICESQASNILKDVKHLESQEQSYVSNEQVQQHFMPGVKPNESAQQTCVPEPDEQSRQDVYVSNTPHLDSLTPVYHNNALPQGLDLSVTREQYVQGQLRPLAYTNMEQISWPVFPQND
ncbi:unnamed protein product [Owenia fusiformis]|uniref:Uncharacterized protein n=1 Tax=Owenia fusiformis TaxID=6347 RepID=A0A8J1XWV1_OWEFU|nr:unnamed protein product [Owenia fusiformis]